MSCLPDTCVTSEPITRQPNAIGVQWVDSVEEDRLFLTNRIPFELDRLLAGAQAWD